MNIYWLGHAAFLIKNDGIKILIDPFIDGNPLFPEKLREEITNPDYILITHGHGDHLGDTIRLYNGNNTKVIANFEICNWLKTKGLNNCIDMNIGGTIISDNIKFTMVPAIHSSSISDGSFTYNGGLASGFLITIKGQTIYHMGDTDAFNDMKLIDLFYKPNVGLVPIGGRYTMSIDTAAYACNEFFNFQVIIPIHFNTFPLIESNPEEFKQRIKKSQVKIIHPGEFIET